MDLSKTNLFALFQWWLIKFLCASGLGWFHNGLFSIAWVLSEQVSVDLFTIDNTVDFITLTLATLLSLSQKTYSVLLEWKKIPSVFCSDALLCVCFGRNILCYLHLKYWKFSSEVAIEIHVQFSGLGSISPAKDSFFFKDAQ